MTGMPPKSRPEPPTTKSLWPGDELPMTEIAHTFTNRAGEGGLVGNCYERDEVSQFHVATYLDSR